MLSIFMRVYNKAPEALQRLEHCKLLPHVTSPTCQKVLNSSNQRFPISRSDKVGFCLEGWGDSNYGQRYVFYEQELLEIDLQKMVCWQWCKLTHMIMQKTCLFVLL